MELLPPSKASVWHYILPIIYSHINYAHISHLDIKVLYRFSVTLRTQGSNNKVHLDFSSRYNAFSLW